MALERRTGAAKTCSIIRRRARLSGLGRWPGPGRDRAAQAAGRGKHRDLLDPMAAYNHPPDPAAQSVSEERRECSRCRGEMRAHPQNRDQFTCVSCGFCELISREVTRGVSCGNYLSQGSDRASHGFRSFDGFGGS